MARHEVAPLPSGTAGHVIHVLCPRGSSWVVFSCQGTCLSHWLPLSLCSWHLRASWPRALVRLGCPVGRGRIHSALGRLAHAHILLLRDCHAQNRVSSPLSWGCPQTGELQRGRCSASLPGNGQSSKTSVCPFGFLEGWRVRDAAMCKLGFSPLACATGFGLTTFLLPYSLLNATLLHKEARFFFFLFAIQIQILQTGPSVNSLLRCSVHIKLQ